MKFLTQSAHNHALVSFALHQNCAWTMKITTQRTSLRSLRTFCAAARHSSFKLAAEELFVTPSAVSHQVKGLEDELGISLFERGARGLTLTEAGQALLDEIGPLIEQIDQRTARFRSRHQRQTLRISVQPFFASELFVPRLAEFTERHPEIDMQIDTSDERSETHPATADVSIRVFRSAPPNLVAEAFYPLRLIPACSPGLHKKIVGKNKKPTNPFPTIVHTRRSNQWQLWSASAGIELPKPSNTVELNSTVAVVRAAEQGLGVAIVPMPLSKNLFDTGRLYPLYKHEAATPDRYYFVSTSKAAELPAVKALRAWVLNTLSPPT